MTVEYITDLSTDALGLVLFRLGSVRLIARTAVVNRAFRAAARVAEQARRRVLRRDRLRHRRRRAGVRRDAPLEL